MIYPNTYHTREIKMNAKERVSLLRALSQNADWKDTLIEALKLHKENEGKPWLGFEWYEAHAAPQTLYRMVTARILDVTFSSHSSTHYMLRDPETVAQALIALEEPVDRNEGMEIPTGLFDVIVGHEKVKRVLNLSPCPAPSRCISSWWGR